MYFSILIYLIIFIGPIGTLLSWGPWQILGRLNYTAYLLHVMIMMAVHQSVYRPIYNITISMVRDEREIEEMAVQMRLNLI